MLAIAPIKILQQAALGIILGSLLASNALAANLITNGTFESPNIGGSGSVSYATSSTAITGWTVDTTPTDGVQIGGSGVLVPSNGSQNLQLTGGPGNTYSAGGGVHQTIATTSNQIYNISIDVASRQNNSVTGKFSFGGQNHVLTATSTTFATLTWSVTATNASPVIDIIGSTASSSAQLIIDNVSVMTPAGPMNAGASTVTASPNSIPADGTTTATITVSLQDASGNPVSGKTITLASSRGGLDTISAASGPSSGSGLVTFTVKSTTTGTAVFSAADATDSLALTSTAAVFVYAVGAKGPQASPVPIVFDQTATNDNLVVLMAAAAEYSSNLTLYQDGPSAYPKHFWINNWSNGTNDYFKWNVALATGAVYHVYAKLSAGAVVPVQLSITGTNTALNFNTRNIGWDKLDCGTINIPAGTNQLMLRKNTTDTSQVISIKSLELIRESDLPAYQQRVANFRADTTWLSQSKYGLMTQFGPWGYPPTGPQPALQSMANGFNVSNFVNLVTNTGCKYVIFSLTWWTYQMLAPIQAVTNIVPGNANLTSTRDVIGELSAALHAAGVRFMLYYHCGSDSQSPGGYNSTPWWQAQQFPEPGYTERGVGDRSIFLTNWCNVISEIGNRYGTNLDGWFIDDGLVYYPAPFEHLGQAAKAGNPNRLLCYNSWIATEYTDFQEVFMGEESQGQSQFGSTPNGGNGKFTDGPQAGLLQHGMFTMEQDWGIHQANQPITTQISANQAIGWVQSASARGVPLSFNMMLWSDMTYSTNSLNVLLNLKSAIYGGGSADLSSNNLVVNGTFETPTVGSGANLLGAGSTAMTGWTVDATPADGVQLGVAGIFGPNNGSQSLQLTGGSTYAVGGGIAQTITTIPGATYTIIIDVASRQGNAITGNFNFGGSNHVLNASSAIFTTLTWKVVSTGTNTLIDITGYTNPASGQLLIDNVSVTQFSDPNITTQPISQSTTNGGTASFSVTAGGTAPFSYQWQATNSATGGFTNLITGGNISGATSNVLTIASVRSNWAQVYRVIVTNLVGSVTSSPVRLTLIAASLLINGDFGAGVTQNGVAVLGTPGDTWNVITASTGALVNSAGNSVSGAGLTLNDYGIYLATAGTATDSGTTNLMQDYAFGYSTTPTVTATITGLAPYTNSAFTLVIYAAGNAVGQGGSLKLTAGAAGGNSASNLITTAASRQISAGLGVAYNTYTGILTNGTLSFNSAILPGQTFTAVNGFQLLLSPISDPAIYSSPQSQTIAPGGNASFSVTAIGSSPFSYQWQVNTGTGFTNLVNGSQISGATNATLTVSNVLPWANPNWVATYQVIVTNSFGSVTSAPASLNCPYVAPGGNVQVAINQAYNNGGGQVNLGPGTFYGNITMYGGVTLNGAGSNTIIAASTISGVQTSPASGYTVQNLVVDGQISCSFFSIGAANVPGIKSVSGLSGLPGINGSVQGTSSYNLTYRNLEVKNTSIGMQCWSVYGLIITNCNFHDDGIGFSHNIYLVGCPGFQIIDSISSWSRTGDALHLDFASDGGFTNSFTQCEFDGSWGIGILDQAWNGSANYTKMKGCGIKYGGQSGGDGTGIDIDYTGDIQATRFEYNHGNGATIRGSTALLYDAFNGNSSAPYFTYAVVSNVLSGGTGANIYHATLADGVTGPNNTADWVTGYGGQTEGAVDFNANHSLNGSLTWPNVSAPSAGTYPLILSYANGTSSNLTMQIIVNGGASNSLTFPPTGGWSTYNSTTNNFALTGANNTVQLTVAYPGATSPILSSLRVTTTTPAVPAAPTGLTYQALTNAPKFDLSCWIRLSWNPVSGATYYNIKRNGLWLATGIPTNGFTDYHVPFTGTAFTYTVVPVNAGGAGFGTTITTYSLTGFPVALTAVTNGPGSVTLTCSWSTNAPTYNAYRSSVSGGPYAFIGSTGLTTNLTVNSTNYFGIYADTNAPGGTNYYVMTAYNGITESLYSPEVAIVVAAVAPTVSTNTYLASLALNPALTFTPAFASNVLSYTATEAYGNTPTVTVVNADLTATNRLIYNNATNILPSGAASAPLVLTLGATNVVTVQVTAQDGLTRQSYTVNVTQSPSLTKPVLTNSMGNGSVNLSWAGDHLGYRLLVQTNNLDVGLSANPNDWATMPGSPLTTATNFLITPNASAGFYRLVYP